MTKSREDTMRRRARRRLAVSLCALAVMLASLFYILHSEQTRREILRGNAEFSALYQAPTLAPTADATSAPTDSPAPTAAPTASPSPTDSPRPTETPTPAPSIEPTPTPAVTQEAAVDVTRAPLSTPDADTLVYAIQTPPPAQESFAELLAANPEAVGFLTIEDVLSLPVVQRPNDNEFYLDHSFDLEESLGGTLFLDGSNLLVPEDDCLIVYGHNMRNGTMFRALVEYEDLTFLKENALVHFDTLYENRLYVPFAALTVTADLDGARYLNLRQFSFDQPGFDRFIRSLRTLSVWNSPIEVEYGDRVLLLVTCEYTHDNGRFVLALRAQRDDEAWDQLWSLAQQSTPK